MKEIVNMPLLGIEINLSDTIPVEYKKRMLEVLKKARENTSGEITLYGPIDGSPEQKELDTAIKLLSEHIEKSNK